MILAGDIGGTSTRLGLFNGDPRVPAALEIYPSREHASLEEMVGKFLRAHPARLEGAAFGIAGPVRNGRCVDTTNLAWPVDASTVAQAAGVEAPILLNDLEANAWGLSALDPDDVAVLNEGDSQAAGNIAVVSAGTGLGLAGLYWDGKRHRPFASEGGHADFAPRNELQCGLSRYLQAEFGHVSYERVCSGMGLVNVYRYLRDTESAGGDDLDAPAITRAALEGTDPTCSWALDLMISIYGAQAGNTALSLMATGGVYLGGGMPPRILPRLRDGGFMRAFLDKGRFQSLMERIPVFVILNDKTALLGAARAAAEGALTS
jgi:glucokinase